MNKFKKEITIIIEGESVEDLTSESLFEKLQIKFVDWWENNPSWPYGKPCKEVIRTEVTKISLKS